MKNTYKSIKESKEILSALLKNNTTLAIHYACLSFTSENSTKTPNVIAISIRNVKTGSNRIFSLLHSAEKLHRDPTLDLNCIEEFEKHMLRSFFRYIKKFPEHDWLHWNMNSDTYGFYALEHRAQTLNITPTVIKDNHKYNLVGILCGIYGDKFSPHKLHTENDIIIYGQLSTLLLLNKDISTKDLIPGALEPQKFQNLQWKEISLSVQRKTACIGAIAKQAELDKLHTQASYWRKHGGFFYGIRNLLSNFWFRLIGLIIGIISGILTIYQYLN